jgi:hypothetical protein
MRLPKAAKKIVPTWLSAIELIGEVAENPPGAHFPDFDTLDRNEICAPKFSSSALSLLSYINIQENGRMGAAMHVRM